MLKRNLALSNAFCRACLIILCAASLSSGRAEAQSFFVTLGTDPVVGADRGSASQISKLDEATGFVTAANNGSDAAGRVVLGFGYALPGLALDGDQLDVAAVWAGPSDDGGRELLAGGLAYRFPLAGGKLTGFASLDYGDVVLGTPEALALAARGDRLQLAVGVRATRDLGRTSRLTYGLEFIGRHIGSELLGTPVIDEDLRMLRASVLFSRGVLFGPQQRLSLAVTKGIDGLGASPSGNLSGSNPGARTDFLRVSLAAEASVPLAPLWTANMGVIGQWTNDGLPLSQRCGFESNSYARGFDYAVVAGDRCLGSRVEIAYDFQRPDLTSGRLAATQGFLGLDGGRFENLATPLGAGKSDSWSSLSVGVRTLQGKFLGEVAYTRILDRPDVAADQDRHRVWIRTAFQF